MAGISIKQPIDLSFDLVDWDSALPSLRAKVAINLKPNRTSTFQLKLNSIWFFCSVWDEFTTSLLTGQTATLTDIDKTLLIQVTSVEEGLNLVVIYNEEQLQDDYNTNIELTAKLGQDSLSILKEQVKNSPKWW